MDKWAVIAIYTSKTSKIGVLKPQIQMCLWNLFLYFFKLTDLFNI